MSTKAVLHPGVGLADARALERSRATGTATFRRVAEGAGDLLLLLSIILCIPVVILAVGIPIALFLQLLLLIWRLIV